MPDIKNELIHLIKDCKDNDFLTEIFEIMSNHNKVNDWWHTLSNEQQNKVEEAMAQYKSGQYITQEEMNRKLDSWRRR